MKKFFFSFLLVLILVVSFISAVDITIKDQVLRGENLVVKVSGTFIDPITKDNIYFYRRHLLTSIEPLGVTYIDGDYYIYAQVPFEKIPDNYSMVIEGVRYDNGIEILDDDLIANFTILDGYAPFSLTPGIMETSTDYEIKIKSLSDSTITVNYGDIEEISLNESADSPSFWESLFGSKDGSEEDEVVQDSGSVTLRPGEEKTLTFARDDFEGLKKIKFYSGGDTYEVLVFLHGNDYSSPTYEPNEGSEKNASCNETGEEKVNASEEGNITIFEESRDSLKEKENSSTFNDSLNGTSANAFVESCEAINASVCKEGEMCEGEKEYSKEGICCVGKCVPKKTSSTGKTIGWILLVGIILFLTWFFKQKYAKTRTTPVNLEKEAKGKKP